MEENNDNVFRQRVIDIGNKSLDILNEFFDGQRHGTDKVKEASQMIRHGVTVSNRNQMDAQVRRSQAIRLIPYIPKDQRKKYISITSPEAKPFLLSRPKKSK